MPARPRRRAPDCLTITEAQACRVLRCRHGLVPRVAERLGVRPRPTESGRRVYPVKDLLAAGYGGRLAELGLIDPRAAARAAIDEARLRLAELPDAAERFALVAGLAAAVAGVGGEA